MREPKVTAATLEDLKRAIPGDRGRALVVNHWATWCDPCLVELSHVRALHRKYGRRADFLGVAWDLFVTGEDVEVARSRLLAFVLGHGLTYDQLLYTGTPDALFRELELPSQTAPLTMIFDASGTLVSTFDRPLLLPTDLQRFEQDLERVLAPEQRSSKS